MFIILFAGPEAQLYLTPWTLGVSSMQWSTGPWPKRVGNPGHEACGKETAEEVLGDDKAIVMFRDGLSEGQFTTGMVMELTAM